MRGYGISLLVGMAIGAYLFAGDVARAAGLLAAMLAGLALLLLAMTVHEYAHGVAALALGDTTARDRGRLTLNPLAHFDLVGLVLFPFLLRALGAPVPLGWAKPVPVDFTRLRHGAVGGAIVAAAGPAASLGLAGGTALMLRGAGIDGTEGAVASAAWVFVLANVAIGLFNLLPVFPMDGGRMAAALLPRRAYDWLLRNEGKATLAAIILVVGLPWGLQASGIAPDPLASVVEGVVAWVDWLSGVEGGMWADAYEGWLRGMFRGDHAPAQQP